MAKRRNILSIVIWVLVVIVVVALVAWAIITKQTTTSPSSSNQNQTSTPSGSATSSEIVQVPGDQIPVGIPFDMPMDANPEVLQNFQTNYPGTEQQQSVREYVTSDTLAEAYANYTNYFENNGWTIGSTTLDQATVKSLSATKGFVSIGVTMGMNSSLNENTVNITANYYLVSFANATSVPISSGSIPADITNLIPKVQSQ